MLLFKNSMYFYCIVLIIFERKKSIIPLLEYLYILLIFIKYFVLLLADRGISTALLLDVHLLTRSRDRYVFICPLLSSVVIMYFSRISLLMTWRLSATLWHCSIALSRTLTPIDHVLSVSRCNITVFTL